ncbi:MAG: 4-diphosphocytidyl-2-C-methyl-D-erythritol kinase [Phycisphaerales bacterium]|jgi:4-diphosphocytidyl-2C-methyl-D-erythritol kinase|nr:4-diphosphocytidyl-2-C-methyl-D-erythritol kinase [Phycisphaerales bacterium]
MRVPAPAKINLHLRVGPPRPADGFHPLLTWMVTAGLFDTLTFVRHARRADDDDAAGGMIFALSCSDPALPTDSAGNLVARVATGLADTLSRVGEGSTARAATRAMESGRVSAFLNKRIPPGAGLAGGSSDAVATLLALNRIWRLGWSREQLSAFAARFGSDLSFFFAETGSAICTGRGEIVRAIRPPDTGRWAVLVLPKFGIATPAVYRRFDEMRLGDERTIAEEPDWLAWSKLSAADLMPRLINDLEPPAFSLRPELGELRAALEKKLNRVFRMSGSGSSLFSLTDSFAEASELSQRAHDGLQVDAIAVEIAPALTWVDRERE